MINILKITQVVLTLLSIVLILIQSKGKGLTSSVTFYQARRGIEKTIFILTFIVLILLVANSLALTLLS